ncbi:unnamed protein product [Rotaria magnacalcarata]|uniref:Uncharacterized protein n=2 Tax=Rotaria magnacalcarata TaxID=392030 RepID=A0A814YJD3_9BILA|nr:unnamed protein product [Rotaria magnacalcarata]CAF1229972.1 unnamed protein product [Rotaria magnacalcarata]
MNEFVLEIFDHRLNKYIIVDEFYINELRSNSYFETVTSHKARIRSRYKNAVSTQLDKQTLSSNLAKETSQLYDPAPPPAADHLIVWLDAYISHPQSNRQLKRYFNMITTIDMPIGFSSQTDIDIDNLIRTPYFNLTDSKEFDGAQKVLWMFSNVDDCVKFIDSPSSSETTIFVISSGSLGRKLVPRIFNNKRIYAIYIFTCNILTQIDWAIHYVDKVLMFVHELDLLIRLPKDIADYYVRKALKTIENPRQSLHYLYWSKKLLNKANNVDRLNGITVKVKQIEAFIERIEACSSNCQTWKNNTRISVECNEV